MTMRLATRPALRFEDRVRFGLTVDMAMRTVEMSRRAIVTVDAGVQSAGPGFIL